MIHRHAGGRFALVLACGMVLGMEPPSAPPAADEGRPAEAAPVVAEPGPVEQAPAPAPPPENGPIAPAPPADLAFPAAGGFSPFLSPVVGRAPLRADYAVAWFPSEPVSGQNTNLGYVRQDLALSFPCWQDGKVDEWSALINVRNELFDTHAILPDTHQPFPPDLWSIRLGTTYRHLFDNGWIAGGTVSVGSASDRPFNSFDEVIAGINAFLRVPSGEHNAWLFSLAYSSNAQLPFPIPMVAYVWQPSDRFRANLGLPFQLFWRPTDDLTFDLSYMLLTTVHARAAYRLCRPVRVYVAYASESEAYLLADRPDVNDRFFNVDQRLAGGVQYWFNPRTSLDLSGGYVFGRYFFEGHSIAQDTHFNRIDVGDGPYLALQFQVRW